ncbi:MAG TPA: MarR family winged helix-turn-helix transcriptional regulator [Solirubrobacteraceae bacterium]|jgi:DNA-binding MarR family transcriptional regulator
MDQLSAPSFDLLAAPGHLIRRAQQQHQARWAELVGSELTSVQFAVLAKLATDPDTDQNTLAGTLSIDTSTVAEVCLRLAGRDLIARRRSEADARRYRLHLTARGRAALERHTPAVDAVGEALLAPLSERERATLMRLLRRVIGA